MDPTSSVSVWGLTRSGQGVVKVGPDEECRGRNCDGDEEQAGDSSATP